MTAKILLLLAMLAAGPASAQDNGAGAAIAGAVTWGSATADLTLPRQTAQQVDSLVRHPDLSDQMKTFGVWDACVAGKRGLRP